MILRTYFDNVMTWNKSLSLSHPFVTEQQQPERRNAGDFCSWIEILSLSLIVILTSAYFNLGSSQIVGVSILNNITNMRIMFITV